MFVNFGFKIKNNGLNGEIKMCNSMLVFKKALKLLKEMLLHSIFQFKLLFCKYVLVLMFYYELFIYQINNSQENIRSDHKTSMR